LLLRIAFLNMQHPERSLHSIAAEVARDARAHQRRGIALESLVSKLERDFKARRQVWLSLARLRKARSEQVVHEDASRLRSNDENRVLGRLIELLPDAIDLYDAVLWEARKAGPEKEKVVRKLGRAGVEALLEDALARLWSTGSFDHGDRTRIPQTLFQLIEPNLPPPKS